MKPIDKIMRNVGCHRGAQMGRRDIGKRPNFETIFDCKVPINNGGYDRGGVYWGLGAPLRVSYTKDLSYVEFYREGK